MVKIRLTLKGSKKKTFYKIIVADSRSPRNGKFIENIGFFHPNKKNLIQKINLNTERMNYWINKGAKLTKTMQKIVKIFKKNNM